MVVLGLPHFLALFVAVICYSLRLRFEPKALVLAVRISTMTIGLSIPFWIGFVYDFSESLTFLVYWLIYLVFAFALVFLFSRLINENR